jgi:hypothetical protein
LQSERIRKILDTNYDSTKKKRRRGIHGQVDGRRLERTLRRRAVAFRRWAARYGKSRHESAALMGISCRTLKRWERDWNILRLPTRALGRPAEHSSSRKRKAVFDVLNILGPHTGLPSLRARFPDLARGELSDLLCKYRKARVTGDMILVHTLNWKVPGAVWAMDFTEPDLPVDGMYPYILSVRDLASHFVLLWLPVRRATAEVACDALKHLFAAHGLPLAIKHDGGSHFKAEVHDLLDKAGVARLKSPPYTPEYNGSIEAGIGNIKTHTHYEAAKRGRPHEWTVDDLEAALLRTNEITRPHGHAGPTPDEMWQSRRLASLPLRRVFLKSVRRFDLDVREESGYNVNDVINKPETERIKRESIARACVAHGLLEVRRRRICLPVLSKKRAII